MALNTVVSTTGYKVKLTVNDGTGGVPNQSVDAGIYWDPVYLDVDTLVDNDFDHYDREKGMVLWCKVRLPTKNEFKIDLKRKTPGATYIQGSAVDCETGDSDTDYVQKT